MCLGLFKDVLTALFVSPGRCESLDTVERFDNGVHSGVLPILQMVCGEFPADTNFYDAIPILSHWQLPHPFEFLDTTGSVAEKLASDDSSPNKLRDLAYGPRLAMVVS